ncbi:hypothetical protein ZWY2020_045364 [Hordeum vulgare]|nr:hypothetical protein ZWY2020_045364 [Hordeum vulgare]
MYSITSGTTLSPPEPYPLLCTAATPVCSAGNPAAPPIRDPHPIRAPELLRVRSVARPLSHLISSPDFRRFYHLSSVSSGPAPAAAWLLVFKKLPPCGAALRGFDGPYGRWFRIAISDIISPAVPPGEVLYFLGAYGSSFLFAANSRRHGGFSAAPRARAAQPEGHEHQRGMRRGGRVHTRSAPEWIWWEVRRRNAGAAGAGRSLAASLALSNRKEIVTPHLGAVNSLQDDVYPVEPYESLSMNQVLDAHWGILDDEDVVVWFSTGYITIKDMVVTVMPIKIIGVAALKCATEARKVWTPELGQPRDGPRSAVKPHQCDGSVDSRFREARREGPRSPRDNTGSGGKDQESGREVEER